MPIKCRHPDGTTHGVHIFCGDVVCGSCERIFDRETEATPMQVIRAAADDEDVAYQASVSDLIWTLYLDDRTRPHDRQKPRDGPWLFPPGSKISAPASGCPPCYAESAQPPDASNRVPIEKPPGFDVSETAASSGSHGADFPFDALHESVEAEEEQEAEEGEEDEEEDEVWGPWADTTTDERDHADDLATQTPYAENHANQAWIRQQANARLMPVEEDGEQEATDEGAPESRERTSFYLSI